MAASRQKREKRAARERLRIYQARQEVHAVQTRRRRRDNLFGIFGGIVVVALAITTQVVYFTTGPGAPEPAPSAEASTPPDEPEAGTNIGAPEATLAENRTWTGQLVFGELSLAIELDGQAAPQAVSGWVQDVRNEYYPGKICHRLANSPDFSFIQCGSLDGSGAGDPDFSYGPVENAPADNIYPAGTIAMARAGNDGYSNGHQFFIITDDTTLPTDSAGGYTVVGQVTSGLADLVSQITSQGIDPDSTSPDGTGMPLAEATITDVTLQ